MVVCSWTLIAFWPSDAPSTGSLNSTASESHLRGDLTPEEIKQRMAIEAEVMLRLGEFKAVEDAIESQLNDLEFELRTMEVEP